MVGLCARAWLLGIFDAHSSGIVGTCYGVPHYMYTMGYMYQ